MDSQTKKFDVFEFLDKKEDINDVLVLSDLRKKLIDENYTIKEIAMLESIIATYKDIEEEEQDKLDIEKRKLLSKTI